MSEKKMVSRSVAIALGIICILLIAFVAYLSITVMSAQNSCNNLQDQNKQLQTWLTGNITDLQNQVNGLNDTLNLVKSTVWIQNATAWPEGGNQFSAPYCGYIKVDINCTLSPYVSHPLARLTVRVTYATLGISYDDNQTIYTEGSAFFPILPCNNILVRIHPLFNFDVATITYYY